jgi:hypothetical protein
MNAGKDGTSADVGDIEISNNGTKNIWSHLCT